MSDLEHLLDEVVETVRSTLADRSHWPESTYRLQFRAGGFTFRNAADIVSYLAQLGVSHIYASPHLQAHPGSEHGYNIVDYGRLNPELGDESDYRAMVETLHRYDMGQILDFVPNHMGIAGNENAWWNDVLENGPSSPFARYFDIEWHPVSAELQNKVLLPLLESQYGEVLEAGLLQLEYEAGAFFLRYHERRLPLDPRTYPTPLGHRIDDLKLSLGPESKDLRELESILTALDYLPARTETTPERVAERHRENEIIKQRLRHLTDECAAVAVFIQGNLQDLNGTPDDPSSFDRLDELLNAQAYRLAHWKAAADEVNYRRFFDINDLAAVCTEDPQVFDSIHRLVLDLLVRGDVDGLRIDHIDGLYDPLDYLQHLQQTYVRLTAQAAYERLRSQRSPAEPVEASTTTPTWEEVQADVLPRLEIEVPGIYKHPLNVVVEKILGPEEPLPADWPVAGTTGYDFMNLVNRLQVEPSGIALLQRIYQRFTNERASFRELAYRAKLLILRMTMASDLQLLVHRLNRISERHRRFRDFTPNTLRTALREILANFPVYRSYIRHGTVPEQGRQFVVRAVAKSKWRNPAMNPAVFDFIRDVLVLEQPPGLDEAGRLERELFVGRFQQVTSPLVAKGVEDTAFYVYVPLASLNEVGGDPTKTSVTIEEFHNDNAERQANRPGSLIATTTHDTKRTEDVRARINVLSEIPAQWRIAVNRWARLNRRHRSDVGGQTAPSRNDEYLFYQTLVGTWPLEPPDEAGLADYVFRIQRYMEKATREAKLRTNWVNPNAEYDNAVRDFVIRALDNHPKNRFLPELRAMCERIVDWGLYSALGQTLLKLTSPGVPDIYQGQELWDFSLVDPDNRRPVDFAYRREMLGQLQADVSTGDEALRETASRLARNPRDPRLKLFVTWRSLQFRRQHAELFRRGQYAPLKVEGTAAEHVCAFMRSWTPDGEQPEQTAVVIAPRLFARLATRCEPPQSGPPLGEAVWGDTRIVCEALAGRTLKNLYTGQPCRFDGTSLPIATAISDFPVALLSDVV